MILFQTEEQSVLFFYTPIYHFSYISDNYLYYVNSLDFSLTGILITAKQLQEKTLLSASHGLHYYYFK